MTTYSLFKRLAKPRVHSTTQNLRPWWRRLLPLFVVTAALGAGKLALSGHLLINFTPSIPRGIYWVSPADQPRTGDLVAFPIPERVRDLVYERHYVPRSIRLLAKPVVAVGGDHVCIRDHQLVVDGQVAGKVLDVDREGKPMPQYSGCGVLRPDELFVATDHDTSFDSRYFGPINRSVVRGTLSALLTLEDPPRQSQAGSRLEGASVASITPELTPDEGRAN